MLRLALISASALSCLFYVRQRRWTQTLPARREPCKIYIFPTERCVRRA
jgi:hypothetical protein